MVQFSVTRERIRQIEAKALRKLKHPSRSKHLKFPRKIINCDIRIIIWACSSWLSSTHIVLVPGSSPGGPLTFQFFLTNSSNLEINIFISLLLELKMEANSSF